VRFLIFGAGAMGSLVGALLGRSHDVTLVGRRPHVERIRSEGLLVSGRTDVRVRLNAIEDVADAAPPDVVILTVKSYDTAEAMAELEPLRDSATFVSLQNGLGNAETLAEHAGKVIAGVTYHGVTFVGPGEVAHAGLGETLLGPVRGTSLEDAEALARAFRACGIPTTATAAIDEALWTKAVVNACFNPLTGLLRVPSGALGRSEPLLDACAMIVEEAVRVAGALGVALDEGAMIERVRAVSDATAENRSSMLQDLERGRRTEIDAINGAIARMGEERGIACPVNRLLTRMVKAAESLPAG
jgi:2-dehydropantoate 2-reductase